MTTYVWVTTDFAGFHRYKDAPDEVAFLRNWHRHVFKVRLAVQVEGLNREVEFFKLKAQLDDFIADAYGGNNHRFEESCEQIAAKIATRFKGTCEVSEDGENGAFVRYEASDRILDGLNMKAGERPPSPLAIQPEPNPIAHEQSNTRDRPFVGIEAEGPNRGKKMLFLPGGTSSVEALCAIGEVYGDKEIEGVYYGAGNDLRFDQKTLETIFNYYPSQKVTVECDMVTKEIYDATTQTGATIVSRNPRDALADYIKTFERNKVIWMSADKKQMFTTLLNDPLFSQDKYL